MNVDKENYLKAITFLVNETEVRFGLNTSIDGRPLKSLSIEEFLKVNKKMLSSYGIKARDGFNDEVVKFGGSLSYLNNRISFFNIKILDFSHYEHLDTLLSLLLDCQESRDVKMFKQEKFYSLIEYVRFIEGSHGSIKNTLSYRYIRLFLMLASCNLIADSSVVAQFLREQILISEGFYPRSRASTIDNSKLEVEIKIKKRKFVSKLKDKIKTATKQTIRNAKDVDDTPSGFKEREEQLTRMSSEEVVEEQKQPKHEVDDFDLSYLGIDVPEEPVVKKEKPAGLSEIMFSAKPKPVKVPDEGDDTGFNLHKGKIE